MVGTGYKMTGEIDQAVAIAEAMLALPAHIAVKEFLTRADGEKLTMTATWRDAQTAEGKPLAPKAVSLVFEFLDKDGVVVTTQGADIGALNPAESQELIIDASGKGITAWRYRRQ